VITGMKPETKTTITKMIDIVTKKKEQVKIFREMKDTITIALEAMKYEIFEEDTIKQILKEIAEMTVKTPCNIINHPNKVTNEIHNTPTIKIQSTVKTQTLICSEVKLYGISQLSITFTIETYEIQTPTKRYIIVTDVKEVKPGW
jgi:hypothetical protein